MRKGQSPTSLADFVAHLQGVSEVSWARLAAYIDGEGSIMINRVKPSGRMKSPAHNLFVSIGNSDPRLMVWLRDTFGGYARPQIQKFREGAVVSKKPRFLWIVNCLKAAYVLEQCLPYFIMKRDQAEVGLAFQALLNRRVRCGRGHSVAPEVVQQRDEFHEKLKVMHAEIIEAPESLMKRTPEKE
jgi:hypothetical protein